MLTITIATSIFGIIFLTALAYQIREFKTIHKKVQKTWLKGSLSNMAILTIIAGTLMAPIAIFTNFHYVGENRIGLITVAGEIEKVSENSYFYLSWNPVRDVHQIYVGEREDQTSSFDTLIIRQHHEPERYDIRVTWQVNWTGDDRIIDDIWEIVKNHPTGRNINETLFIQEVGPRVLEAARIWDGNPENMKKEFEHNELVTIHNIEIVEKTNNQEPIQ